VAIGETGVCFEVVVKREKVRATRCGIMRNVEEEK
jgi:hypothetical protein